jgi:hypothetical protein
MTFVTAAMVRTVDRVIGHLRGSRNGSAPNLPL